jgi:hypothetical protein
MEKSRGYFPLFTLQYQDRWKIFHAIGLLYLFGAHNLFIASSVPLLTLLRSSVKRFEAVG